MLTLESMTVNRLYTVIIRGPEGRIQIQDLIWCVDRQDILEIYYWEAWAVLKGAYHCCLSLPGKVSLLPE
jgi:hypothetical protein